MIEFIKNHIALSITLLCVITAIIALIWWIVWANKAIQLNKVSIIAPCELKIAHISDFHNAKFKNNNKELVALVKMLSQILLQ